jgi:predicted nucleic-acid-binding Zn-ribbon protein
MPQRVFCSGCKKTLYEGPELESPQEVIEQFIDYSYIDPNSLSRAIRYKCPKCGKELKFDPDKVKILPNEAYEKEEPANSSNT